MQRKRIWSLGIAWALCLMLMPIWTSAQVYQLDDTADAIGIAQQVLTDLKLYTGNVTGHFGSKTQAAVLAFQKKYALEQNGVLDEETLEAIYEAGGIADTDANVSASTGLMKLGDESSEVLTLQKNLTALGYYSGSLTGRFGSLTKAAVQKFQKAQGLTADGIAGSKTLSAIAQKLGTASGDDADADSSSLLQLGSKSEAVLALQQNLMTLGYYSGNITGNFGNLTKAAVIKFQKAYGLTADGIAGTKTLAKIASALGEKSFSTSSTAVSVSSSNTTLDTGSTLQYESSSTQVKLLQTILKELGYYNGNLTGNFGELTKEAVIAYQKSNGLTADGIAGARTLALLNTQYKALNIGSSSASSMAASVLNTNFYNWRTKYSNGETCLVYDYKTGYSWTLRILSKDAHMDAEPYTLSDTENMNRAFGGKTTWTPKPVWVTFSDGKTYLGTTHNTPHDTYSIKDNGFDGHVCVHFTISMEKAESIGSYAVSHQEALLDAWEETQALAQ